MVRPARTGPEAIAPAVIVAASVTVHPKNARLPDGLVSAKCNIGVVTTAVAATIIRCRNALVVPLIILTKAPWPLSDPLLRCIDILSSLRENFPAQSGDVERALRIEKSVGVLSITYAGDSTASSGRVWLDTEA